MAAHELVGKVLVVVGLAIGTTAFASAESGQPLESPDEDECYEWTYPKDDACGSLSGKTECKARPSIEASDDEAKKEKCQPTKGDTCFCE